jgi:hypothetical protein
MPTVSTRWDIVSLIEHYANIQVVGRPSVVRGVTEVHSNCPFCPGSKDGFIMRPETGQFTHSIRSKGCDKTGDGIDFLMWYKGMERWEAIQELALENVSFYENKPEITQGQDSPSPKQWQETGKNFVERAARYLWGKAPAAQKALAYLRGRGLSDETIKKKKYGYCPLCKNGRWFGEDPKEGAFEVWGLKPEDIKDEKKRARGTLLIPPGIVIPWFEGDVLWKIEINRYTEPNKKDRYGQVLGSAEGLYNVGSIQYGKPVMLVENVYCAASVEQVAGDLVACVATGSADRGRSPRWTAELMQASYIIQAFDDDEAGEKGAEHWLNIYEKCFRFQPCFYKDPNDMLKNLSPEELRNWVLWALYTWDNAQRLDNLPTPARVTEELPVVVEEPEEEMAPHWQDLLAKVEQRAEVLGYEPTPARVMTDEETTAALLYAKMAHDACLQVNREMQAEYVQEQFERLCISDRVQTPQGPGRYWDPKQLREHCERGQVRVTLDSGKTLLFAPGQLEPELELVNLSF